MEIIECTVFIILLKLQTILHNPITEEKGHVSHYNAPFVLQCMVSLANDLPLVWENKVNMPCMYSLFILYIFKDNANNLYKFK